MEHPELGEHCTWTACKLLDFLPFTCIHCKAVFCKDHFNPLAHECPQAQHESNDPVNAAKTFMCSHADCGSLSPVEMFCPKCSQHFCLAHRYHSCFNESPEELEKRRKEWNAPKEQFAESLKDVQNMVTEGIKKAQSNPKQKATANKVQLMRLKGKAKGLPNIPTTDRVYFLICLPKEKYKNMSKEVYISKHWSLGRCIDAIAEISDVMNRNNVADAPKLRLFRRADGAQLSADLSILISSLLDSGDVVDGGTLILEYVQSDVSSHVIENIADY